MYSRDDYWRCCILSRNLCLWTLIPCGPSMMEQLGTFQEPGIWYDFLWPKAHWWTSFSVPPPKKPGYDPVSKRWLQSEFLRPIWPLWGSWGPCSLIPHNCTVLSQSNLLKGIVNKTIGRWRFRRLHPGAPIVYLCRLLSNTLFIRQQNGTKLQGFFYKTFSKIQFPNSNQTWSTLFVKTVFCFKLK